MRATDASTTAHAARRAAATRRGQTTRQHLHYRGYRDDEHYRNVTQSNQVSR